MMKERVRRVGTDGKKSMNIEISCAWKIFILEDSNERIRWFRERMGDARNG